MLPVLCLFPLCVQCPAHTAEFALGMRHTSGRFLSVLTHTFMCQCNLATGGKTHSGEAHCPHVSQALNYATSFFLKGCDFLLLSQRPLCLHQQSPKLMRAEATTTEQRTPAPHDEPERPCSAEEGALSHGGPAHGTTKGSRSHTQSFGHMLK